MKPVIGNWYRIQGSESFEVVAFDEDDDVRSATEYGEDDDRRQSASKLEGLDLFE